MTKKMRGHSGKRKMSCRLSSRNCGFIWKLARGLNVPKIQTLKWYLFCHIHCARLCTRVHAIVTASCVVSNRESRYPPYSSRLTHIVFPPLPPTLLLPIFPLPPIALPPFFLSLILSTPSFSKYVLLARVRSSSTWGFMCVCLYAPPLPS